MMDDSSAPPEVTIEPADNGHVVRWHQRSAKKDESGRTIRRVASSVDDALEHARAALGGTGRAGKRAKKRESSAEVESQEAVGAGSGAGSGTGSDSMFGSGLRARSSSRRRRPRSARKRG